ncbi:unannotated protein [freshwater metagenome]|uniref:Unannotated protein n=1 Tax=freshwater metagenome TaxID=449393 RepID=A0A6J6YMC7_9ZZZZ
MEASATHYLNVEVALPKYAACCLPHGSEGLWHQIVEVLAICKALLVDRSEAEELIVAASLHLRLEGCNKGDDGPNQLEFAAIAGI